MLANELIIDFVSPGEVFAAGLVLPLVEISVVGWRFLVRYNKFNHFGVDDWLILASLVFSLGMGVALLYGASKQVLGYPTPPYPDLGPETPLIYASEEQRLTELLDWITWILMIPANGRIKLSAVFMYRRIFVVNTNTVFGFISLATAVICALWTVTFEFATIFGCGLNVNYAWSPLIYIASCNTNMRLDALMISDLITDIMVWILPIPMVWSLKMKASRKLSISGIFLLAAMSLAAAVVRLIVQEEISHGGYAAHTDVNLTLTTLLYWSNIETGLALIAACLPTLHVALTQAALSSAFNSLRSVVTLSSLRSRQTTKAGSSEYSYASSNEHSNASHWTSHAGYGVTEQEHDWDRHMLANSLPVRAKQAAGNDLHSGLMPA